MSWVIRIHEQVAEFVDTLSCNEAAKVAWCIDLLQETGTQLREPCVKHVLEKIWELRITNIRILYLLEEGTFVLLNAFRKKTRKTPTIEINIALRRMKDYIERRKD